MFKVGMIALGGALGATLRYFIAGWIQRFSNGSFPAGTLFVNAAGCLFIGLLGAFFSGPHLVREEYRLGVLVGGLGAFTTFSTFGWETLTLANGGQAGRAAGNILLHNGLGLLAVWLGYRVGMKWFGA